MQRAWVAVLALVVLCQLAYAQKELAGAFIEGNDLCPPTVKQAPAPPPASPQRSSSFSRVFSRKQTTEAAPAPAPACRLAYKYCSSDVNAVAARCQATRGCKAFSYDGRCGYLKSSSGPRKARVGWTTYVLA